MSVPRAFDFEQGMKPLWSGDTVYDESVMFFPEAVTGKIPDAPLLYTPEQVLEVRSADLQTVYREGTDYLVINGCIHRLPDSRIPLCDYEELYPSEKPTNWIAIHKRIPERYVRILDGIGFPLQQAVVTYTHKDVWQGPTPAFAGDKLPLTLEKLQKKQPLRIVFFGDSITVGHNASALHGYEPYMPIFVDLFTARLREVYEHETIEVMNTAVSGMDSRWGADNVREHVAVHRPDLCVIGFGMNDSYSREQEEQHIRAIIDGVRGDNPQAEIILISSHLANPDALGYGPYIKDYVEVFRQIADDLPGVVVAPVTDIHEYLLTRKRYLDMTGNGVNHPNDFLIRIHAQCLTQLLCKGL